MRGWGLDSGIWQTGILQLRIHVISESRMRGGKVGLLDGLGISGAGRFQPD